MYDREEGRQGTDRQGMGESVRERESGRQVEIGRGELERMEEGYGGEGESMLKLR